MKLQLESNNLLEEIKRAQDIETISYDDDLLKNSGNGKFTLEDGKLINMEIIATLKMIYRRNKKLMDISRFAHSVSITLVIIIHK